MKLFKKMLIVLVYVCTSSLSVGSDRAGVLTVDFVKKEIVAAHKKTPQIEAELRKQYPNPTDANAVELYRFVSLVRKPLLMLFSKNSAKESTDDWVVSEASTILEASQQGHADLQMSTPEKGIAHDAHAVCARQFRLYKEELNKRHPKLCPTCPKSLWRGKPRCAVLHKECELYLPALTLFEEAARLEQRDPELLSKYAKLDPTLAVRKAPQETKDDN